MRKLPNNATTPSSSPTFPRHPSLTLSLSCLHALDCTRFYDTQSCAIQLGYMPNPYGSPPIFRSNYSCQSLFDARQHQTSTSDFEPYASIAIYVPEIDRARRWVVAARMPYDGPDPGSGDLSSGLAPSPPPPTTPPPSSTIVTVPDLRMAVHDAKIVGNNNVTVSARIHSFSGTCSGGSSSTPVLVGPTSTLTDANGVAALALQMEVAGCTAGDVVVELYLPDYHEDERICRMRVKNGNAFVNANSSAIHRYALVQLYQQNPNLQYTSTVNLETTANPDNFTVITTASRVDIDSTVTSRTQNTFVNQTTWRYNDSAQTILDSVTSIPTTFTETSAPQPMLVVLQSPSNTTTMRRKMPITVQVLTEHGLPIAGSEVSVLLMAPINTNAKLSGVQRAFTDVTGTATMDIHFERGRSGNYSLLIMSTAVLDALQRPNGLTSIVSARVNDLQTQLIGSVQGVLQSELATRLQTIQSNIQQRLQTQLQSQLQAQIQQTTQQMTTAATGCVTNALQPTSLSALASSATSGADPTAQIQSCMTTAIQGNVQNLQASVTQTLTNSIQDLASDPRGFGIDTTTLVAQLQPLLQQAILTAINQVPGLNALTSTSGVPRSASELRDAAQNVARALWSLLPLPAPSIIFLDNGLDAPGYGPPQPLQTVGKKNGVNFTAPLTGYALSESSDSTNQLSGMSSCTLEGYIRNEPSPMGQSFLFYSNLLQPPSKQVPSWATDRLTGAPLDVDEQAGYFSSALWQPFPFNNFNFLFDNPEKWGAYNTAEITACKKTYMTRGTSFPFFMDASFNMTMDPLGCPGDPGRRCLMNTPDETTATYMGPIANSNDQSHPTIGPVEGPKCINEYTRMWGPDATPSVNMLKYGGLSTLAVRLECLSCFDDILQSPAKECDPRMATIDMSPSNLQFNMTTFQVLDPNATFGLQLDSSACVMYMIDNKERPGVSFGESLQRFMNTPMYQAQQPGVAQSPGIADLITLTKTSGWNGCYSKRFRRNQTETRTFQQFVDDMADPAYQLQMMADPTYVQPITGFSPAVYLEVQAWGEEIKNDPRSAQPSSEIYAVFGGVPPDIQLRDRNPTRKWEWVPLKIETLLILYGGLWQLFNMRIIEGGSRRDLDLEVLIDGVPVGNVENSWWKFDNTIEYVDPDDLNFGKIDILFLVGHDGFRVFALLTIPVFYLNMHGRTRRMPGYLGTAAGCLCALLFMWYMGAALRNVSRDVTPALFNFPSPFSHSITSILAFGKNDIVAVKKMSEMEVWQVSLNSSPTIPTSPP